MIFMCTQKVKVLHWEWKKIKKKPNCEWGAVPALSTRTTEKLFNAIQVFL